MCAVYRSEPNSRQGKVIMAGLDNPVNRACKGVYGLVAQLEERRLCEAEALGSNPSESILDAPSKTILAWEGRMVSIDCSDTM